MQEAPRRRVFRVGCDPGAMIAARFLNQREGAPCRKKLRLKAA
jgi:hypothetical protein